MFNIPKNAIRYGFIVDGLGSHSSRTIMLAELQMLLAACSPEVNLEVYRAAILNDNVLLKQTESTRKESLRRLRQLYGLDPGLVIFRTLHELWEQDTTAQPLLALFCALGRDPALRMTASVILDTQPGEAVNAERIARAAQEQYSGQLNATSLANIGRNTASSWTQSGHLQGRSDKVRTRVNSQPVSTAYALFLGYLCGDRGEALFHTDWAKLLDAPLHSLHEKALQASQHGWLEYRHAGNITDITFRYLLRERS